MRCQMKRIEMCFIAPRSLGANAYNHLTNVIAHWKHFQILFFLFFSFFLKFALTERRVGTSSEGSINHFVLFEIAIIGFRN